MNIYPDVDGVPLKHDGTLAPYAEEFLTRLIRSCACLAARISALSRRLISPKSS